jgi:hypothetical protein
MTAFGCAVAAIVLLQLLPVVFGAPVLLVHITWRGVNDDAQRDLERRFRLSEPTTLADGTWQYVPLEPTTETLRAIVRHPAVAATDGIDRRALRMSPRAPRTGRRGGLISAPLLARATKLAAYTLLLCAALLLLAAGTGLTALDRARVGSLARRVRAHPREVIADAIAAARGFLERGVPVATAEAAAAFRVALGVLVLWFVASHPAADVSLDAATLTDATGIQHAVANRVAASPSGAQVVDRLLLVSGSMFVAGLFTRLASAGLAAAFFLWACVFTLNTSHHTVSALAVTLFCIVGAPAGDAWSLDALLRRRNASRPSAPGTRYGFLIWIPGFVFGLAFLAAAWAKVGTGPAWILDGTVKYHFASDLEQALVSWGPALTKYSLVAIGLSAAGVAIELGLIVASFTRSAAIRLALGASAAMLLTGFALFQGVIWPAWWMLLISFLPWQAIRKARLPAQASIGSLPPLRTSIIVAVACVQATASLESLEVRPILSAYDMYSTSYATEAEYEASLNLVYRVTIATDGNTSDVPQCELDDTAVTRISEAASPVEQLTRELARHGGGCDVLQGRPDAVTLVGDRKLFDFESGRFVWQRGVDRVGPIALR